MKIKATLAIVMMFVGGSAAAEEKASNLELIFKPLGSFVLPGMSQWIDGEYMEGSLYSGIALAGYGTGIYVFNKAGYSLSDPDVFENHGQDRNFRFSLVAIETGKFMGELSLYDSFRTQIKTRPEDFAFLKKHDSIREITLAPFDFSYLKRPTTFVPILAIAALSAYQVKHDKELERDALTSADVFYATSGNYAAAVGEEAMFRGWALPMTMLYTGNEIWANVLASSVFTVSHFPAHGTGNAASWFASGMYFGYVTQKNDWSIGESIFIHTWTNFAASIAEYSYKKKQNIKNANIWLPPLTLVW